MHEAMDSILFLLPFLLLISLASPSWSPAIASYEEAEDFPCVKELLPCRPYRFMSTPPAMCCLPLLIAVQKDLACLCAVFYSEPILIALNLTQEEALNLPRSCGGDVPDVGRCRGSGSIGGDKDWPSSSSSASANGSSPSSASIGNSIVSRFSNFGCRNSFHCIAMLALI